MMNNLSKFIPALITRSHWLWGALFITGLVGLLGGFAGVFRIYLLGVVNLHPLQVYIPFFVGIVCYITISCFQENGFLRTIVNLISGTLYFGSPLLGICALASMTEQSKIALKLLVVILLILSFLASRAHLKRQGMLIGGNQ